MPATKELLPAPFDWCEIPAGKVTIAGSDYFPESTYIPTGGKTFDVLGFCMAKYPVTNAQYKLFVDAGGYENKAWWTEAGWNAKEEGIAQQKWQAKKTWTEPLYWQDSDFNNKEQPVVGVSWYESLAFCSWLDEITSEKISLPTEQEWQRAAQGDDNRYFAWGNRLDGTYCNHNVDGEGIRKTSPVRQYEGIGDSPFGVVDMTGNVWEWCLTDSRTGSLSLDKKGLKIVRGGAWNDNDPESLEVFEHNDDEPYTRLNIFGFRIAKSL